MKKNITFINNKDFQLLNLFKKKDYFDSKTLSIKNKIQQSKSEKFTLPKVKVSKIIRKENYNKFELVKFTEKTPKIYNFKNKNIISNKFKLTKIKTKTNILNANTAQNLLNIKPIDPFRSKEYKYRNFSYDNKGTNVNFDDTLNKFIKIFKPRTRLVKNINFQTIDTYRSKIKNNIINFPKNKKEQKFIADLKGIPNVIKRYYGII